MKEKYYLGFSCNENVFILQGVLVFSRIEVWWEVINSNSYQHCGEFFFYVENY